MVNYNYHVFRDESAYNSSIVLKSFLPSEESVKKNMQDSPAGTTLPEHLRPKRLTSTQVRQMGNTIQMEH